MMNKIPNCANIIDKFFRVGVRQLERRGRCGFDRIGRD